MAVDPRVFVIVRLVVFWLPNPTEPKSKAVGLMVTWAESATGVGVGLGEGCELEADAAPPPQPVAAVSAAKIEVKKKIRVSLRYLYRCNGGYSWIVMGAIAPYISPTQPFKNHRSMNATGLCPVTFFPLVYCPISLRGSSTIDKVFKQRYVPLLRGWKTLTPNRTCKFFGDSSNPEPKTSGKQTMWWMYFTSDVVIRK